MGKIIVRSISGSGADYWRRWRKNGRMEIKEDKMIRKSRTKKSSKCILQLNRLCILVCLQAI